MYKCFVGFEKAFDTVKREILLETLRRYDVDEADTRIITTLYLEQNAGVGIDDENSG